MQKVQTCATSTTSPPPPPETLLLEIFTHNHRSIKKKKTFLTTAGVFFRLLAAFQAHLFIPILSAFDGVMEAHCEEALFE